MSKIEINGNMLGISLEEIIQGMDYEQKREMLSWLATDAEVVDSVIAHITGQDEHGWSFGDRNTAHKILTEVEKYSIENPLRYNWSVWSSLLQKLKDIRSTEHIYWILYHKIDPELSHKVFNELRRLGVESNYTTRQGDEDINEIKKMIEETFEKMKKPLDESKESGKLNP